MDALRYIHTCAQETHGQRGSRLRPLAGIPPSIH